MCGYLMFIGPNIVGRRKTTPSSWPDLLKIVFKYSKLRPIKTILPGKVYEIDENS